MRIDDVIDCLVRIRRRYPLHTIDVECIDEEGTATGAISVQQEVLFNVKRVNVRLVPAESEEV